MPHELSTNSQSFPVDDHTYSVSPRPVFKTLHRKLYPTVGSFKREPCFEPNLAEHVPDMDSELEIRSTVSSQDSRKQAKLKRMSTRPTESGVGRGRGRGRSRSRGRGRGRAMCR